MKTKRLMGMTFIAIVLGQTAIAARAGDKIGGGGDGSGEPRVYSIRQDLLEWIQRGGSSQLQLPEGVSLEEYDRRMTAVLEPHAVIVTFVPDDSSPDEELRVQVDGKPKTCRGFQSARTDRLSIVCNIPRFERLDPAGQYRLIHHEYAGLAGLEVNEGASSSYEISNQVPDFLEKSHGEFRLTLKRKNSRPSKLKSLMLQVFTQKHHKSGKCVASPQYVYANLGSIEKGQLIWEKECEWIVLVPERYYAQQIDISAILTSGYNVTVPAIEVIAHLTYHDGRQAMKFVDMNLKSSKSFHSLSSVRFAGILKVYEDAAP